MRPVRIELRLGVSFAVLLALVAAGLFVAWRTSGRVRAAAELVAHTEAVRGELNGILAQSVEAEVAVRGFIITAQEPFAAPYTTAGPELEAGLGRLRALTADNVEQQRRLDALQPLVAGHLATLARVFDVMRAEGPAVAQALIASGVTKASLDNVRASVAAMEAVEARLLAERQAGVVRAGRQAWLVHVALAVLITTVLGGSFLLVRHHLRARTRAEHDIEKLFATSLDLLCVASMDGYFKRVNPAFAATLGFSEQEILARPFLEMVHPEDRERTIREVERQIGGQPVMHFENRYRTRDGTYRWLTWKSVPDAAAGLMYAGARDTTELRRATDALRASEESLARRAHELQEANQELEAFSYSVSHDLRAPLRHVQGYADMLARAVDGQLPEKAQRYLRVINDASADMGRLIDDLLSFSRMGRAALHEDVVDLDALVAQARAGDELATRDRRITWVTPPLPRVRADAAMLNVALVNLIGNAIKFTRPRAEARIEVGCAGHEDGRVILFVRDNGVGFDMAYRDKLFGVFQRLHGQDEFEGTGIGLANVRRVITRHGGRVWAESAVGAGATFFFTLRPAAPPAAGEPKP